MESNKSLPGPSVGATSRFASRRSGSTPLQRDNPSEIPGGDIYRGALPQLPEAMVRVRSPNAASSGHSSSSSASTGLVARAIAAVVELAISRWARPSASTSSSSSTTSSTLSTTHAKAS
ncbi:uncharacterized protein EI90DRAFT_3135246 [Cantharellus anzutake]|uniref:uncharacterized protein n=1 Tax=Cantharellus anzutake TaxID=1750568 RepID=UPI0019086A92|nr:uncharacterized protein EI90DRAFT_3135246 [Cantharellus anzutake]KAF8315488.1 hypothetical protein EI90DRAFT_3135246 [Cantharellus anzutake]